MSLSVIKEYDAHLDAKKRVTLRDAKAEYYSVRMFSDGHVLLEPRVLVPPQAVSRKTLAMMDKAASNFKKRRASKPVDLDKYL